MREYICLSIAPLTPTHFLAMEQYPSHYQASNTSVAIVTLQWDPPQASPQSMPRWYELEISPQPYFPVVNVVSSPVNLTLLLDMEYTATLKAANCIGSSAPVSISIQLGESLVAIKLQLLNSSARLAILEPSASKGGGGV